MLRQMLIINSTELEIAKCFMSISALFVLYLILLFAAHQLQVSEHDTSQKQWRKWLGDLAGYMRHKKKRNYKENPHLLQDYTAKYMDTQRINTLYSFNETRFSRLRW